MKTRSWTLQTRVSPPVPEHGTAPVPHGLAATSSPLTTTLLLGEEEALLVDPPWHVDAARDTIAWIEASGRRLTSVYITHGHGDHWIGAAAIQDAFPEAALLATRGTMTYMKRYSRDREALWDDRFPGQVVPGYVSVRMLTRPVIPFDGGEVQVLELGHTDTDDTTALWVPDMELLVAGDSVYQRCHLAVNEVDGGGAEEWLAVLDRLEALAPRVVVAGHKHPDAADDPGAIALTRRYLTDIQTLLVTELGRLEIFDRMLVQYPDFANPKALWRGLCALLPAD